MPNQPIFAPDGSIRDIPDDQVQSALSAGGRVAVRMKDPQGTLRYVPQDSVEQAKQAGGTLADNPTPHENSIWTAVKEFGKEINPITALTGLRDAVNSPIDSLNAAGENMVKRWKLGAGQIKQGDIAGGSANLLYGTVPFVGEAVAQRGDQFARGEIAKGVGGSLGIGVNLAAPGAVKGAKVPEFLKQGTAKLSERMYQSALKPPPGSYSSGEVKDLVSTGLKNEIPISSGGAEKLNSLVENLRNEVSSRIEAGNKSGATVNKFDVSRRLGDTARRFDTQASPTSDLKAIAEVGNDFLDTKPGAIPVSEAQAIKSGTYRQLRSKYGELGSASTEAQKDLARGLKEELEAQFPEIKGLNAKEGKLIGLDVALDRAIRRIDNRDIFSLGGKVATAGAGTIAGLETGHGTLGAVTGLVMHEVMTNPQVQSRLAIALNKAGRGKVGYGAAKARVAAYGNAIGQAVSASSGGENDGQ